MDCTITLYQDINRSVPCRIPFREGLLFAYAGDQSFGTQLKDHQNKPITKDYHFKKQGAEYPIRLFVNPETKELLWLTCELRASLDYPNTRKFPLNISLPTPA